MDRNNALTDPKKLVRVELKMLDLILIKSKYRIEYIFLLMTFLMKWCQEM